MTWGIPRKKPVMRLELRPETEPNVSLNKFANDLTRTRNIDDKALQILAAQMGMATSKQDDKRSAYPTDLLDELCQESNTFGAGSRANRLRGNALFSKPKLVRLVRVWYPIEQIVQPKGHELISFSPCVPMYIRAIGTSIYGGNSMLILSDVRTSNVSLLREPTNCGLLAIDLASQKMPERGIFFPEEDSRLTLVSPKVGPWNRVLLSVENPTNAERTFRAILWCIEESCE
jgi:hypothetical protein